ncbi:MAG: PP2C family protein-serine/threonine phosphatase [Kineosporiaceae bacterium]
MTPAGEDPLAEHPLAHCSVLVVHDPGPEVGQLLHALEGTGVTVSLVAASLLDDAAALVSADVLGAHVLLVPAALDAGAAVDAVDLMGRRHGPAGPQVVTFAPAGAEASLAAWVDAGFDYLIAPFSRDVLLRRLVSCTADRVEHLVRHVGDNTQLAQYERELQIGREIQQGFLPAELPRLAGYEVEVSFRPAREVAGDFYDAFPVVGGHRTGFVVADVCDKGVGSALFMALIRSLVRHSARHVGGLNIVRRPVLWMDTDEPGPPRRSATAPGIGPLLGAVVSTNEYMTENHLAQAYFATLFFGVLDPETGALLYINGGHNPPLLRAPDGALTQLWPTGPAVGIIPTATYRIGQATVPPGGTLLMYTDGVTEARNEVGEFFGDSRLLSALGPPVTGAAELIERVDRDLQGHVGRAPRFDDVTMMAVHRCAGAGKR